jgi:hypothetical protein
MAQRPYSAREGLLISYVLGWRLLTIGAAVFTGLLMSGPVRADVISSTPTLPVLGVPYVAFGSGQLLSRSGSGGAITLTSLVSETFNTVGQDLLSNATFTGELTTLGSTPIGPVILTGMVEQEALGRTTSTQTGTWDTDLLAVSLSGPVQGHTLTLNLAPSPQSSGQTTIAPIGDLGFQRL